MNKRQKKKTLPALIRTASLVFCSVTVGQPGGTPFVSDSAPVIALRFYVIVIVFSSST